MIRPKNETEDLLLSIIKTSETINKQTHRKAEQKLEFRMVRPRKPSHFNILQFKLKEIGCLDY